MTRPKSTPPTSRRSLLKAAAGCGMMTNTSLISTLLNLQATKSAAAAGNPSGHKAIVCLFLLGGNDSFNMLAPLDGTTTSGEYGDYYAARGGVEVGNTNPGGLAIAQADFHSITGPAGRTFGVHPGMPEIASLYRSNVDPKYDKKLAFVANVGSLIRPTTPADYFAQSDLPLGLFSHADLQRHWMSGVPQSRSQITGWGGRMADLMQDTNSNPNVSMNISIDGVNLFQTGGSVVPYTIGSSGATVVTNYYDDVGDAPTIQDRIFTRHTDSLLGQVYNNLLAKSLAESSHSSITAALQFNDAINNVTINSPFPQGELGKRFEVIAKCIGAAGTLGQTRQVFFVMMDGYDNHSALITAQNSNLPDVSGALKAFYDATVDMGVENDVVTFTASDFARTLSTNGQGSDHAWGGQQIVMGGCVKGGEFFGDYPTSLAAGNPLDLGRGRLVPTTSVDEFAAELAMWFGIGNDDDLVNILPNIRNFYASSETLPPLQMLN